MQIAASDSHGIIADSSSATAVPLPLGSQDPLKVSLFDLLLSQLIAPSSQVNSSARDEKTSTSDLTTDLHRIGAAMPHLPKQKSASATDSATTNPLTNLLFLSNGPAFQKGTPETISTTGINSDPTNAAKSSGEPTQAPATGSQENGEIRFRGQPAAD